MFNWNLRIDKISTSATCVAFLVFVPRLVYVLLMINFNIVNSTFLIYFLMVRIEKYMNAIARCVLLATSNGLLMHIYIKRFT